MTRVLHCSKRTQCTTPQLITNCAGSAQLNIGCSISVPSSLPLRHQAIPTSLMKTKHTVLSSPLPLLCTLSPSLRHSVLFLDRRPFKSALSFQFRSSFSALLFLSSASESEETTAVDGANKTEAVTPLDRNCCLLCCESYLVDEGRSGQNLTGQGLIRLFHSYFIKTKFQGIKTATEIL